MLISYVKHAQNLKSGFRKRLSSSIFVAFVIYVTISTYEMRLRIKASIGLIYVTFSDSFSNKSYFRQLVTWQFVSIKSLFIVVNLYLIEERPSCIAGVEHVGGDMFVSVPKGDAIFMKVSFQICNIYFLSYPISWLLSGIKM